MLKIVLEKGQQLFLTSDTHYGHTNICRGTSKWEIDRPGQVRDFDTLDHMNDTIVNGINSTVGENDILIHDGDWSFGGIENIFTFRERIICRNIYLLYGNHDEKIIDNKMDCQDLFTWTGHYANLTAVFPQENKGMKAPKFKAVLSHFPIASYDEMGKGRIHLHGHVHLPSHLKLNNRALDVGVDGNNFIPYSTREISTMMKYQPIGPIVMPQDHHYIQK